MRHRLRVGDVWWSLRLESSFSEGVELWLWSSESEVSICALVFDGESGASTKTVNRLKRELFGVTDCAVSAWRLRFR